MIDFKNVTLVSLDTCEDYISKNNIRIATISRIVPFLLDNINFGNLFFVNPFNKNHELIEMNGGWYNDFVLRRLPFLIKTEFFLVIQWDGFPYNFDAWNDDYFNYDYVGGGDTVQNGGFSLRRTESMIAIANDFHKKFSGNEDGHISHYFNDRFNSKYKTSFKLKTCDEILANKFSYFSPVSHHRESFGWHRSHWIPEQEISDFYQHRSNGVFTSEEIEEIILYSLSVPIRQRTGSKLLYPNYIRNFYLDYNDNFFDL